MKSHLKLCDIWQNKTNSFCTVNSGGATLKDSIHKATATKPERNEIHTTIYNRLLPKSPVHKEAYKEMLF